MAMGLFMALGEAGFSKEFQMRAIAFQLAVIQGIIPLDKIDQLLREVDEVKKMVGPYSRGSLSGLVQVLNKMGAEAGLDENYNIHPEI